MTSTKNAKQTSFYEFGREKITHIDLLPGPTDCQPHWHQAVEILCALDDEIYTLVNSTERILLPGEICVADCFDVHSFNSYKKPALVLVIPSEFLGDYLNVKGEKHLATSYLNEKLLCDEIRGCIEKFREPLPPLLQKGYVNVILGLIASSCGFEEHSNPDLNLMRKILQYLELHYNEEISLDSLSRAFGYSRYYFSRMFGKFFKFSLSEYLSRLRARKFLLKMQEDKNADIIETAYDCGFQSWQTFYRCFKRYYGVSPKQYIQNL